MQNGWVNVQHCQEKVVFSAELSLYWRVNSQSCQQEGVSMAEVDKKNTS